MISGKPPSIKLCLKEKHICTSSWASNLQKKIIQERFTPREIDPSGHLIEPTIWMHLGLYIESQTIVLI